MPPKSTRKRRLTAAVANIPPKSLKISTRDQDQTEWCWAACAQMVLRHKGRNVKQCTIVDQIFGKDKDCCADEGSCNKPCKLRHILQIYEQRELAFDFHNVDKGGSLPAFQELQAAVDGGSPIEVGVRYTNSKRCHVVVVTGYFVNSLGEWVIVNDPAEDSYDLLYSDLVKFRSRGDWIWTWTHFREK